jgi:HEAT repeat protein
VSETFTESFFNFLFSIYLFLSIYSSQRFYKKAAAFVLRAVAKHSPDLAQAVVDSNALETLVPCLEEFDPTVKEAAAWAIGYIAQHTPGKLALIICIFVFPLNVNMVSLIITQSLRSMLSMQDQFHFSCFVFKNLKLL